MIIDKIFLGRLDISCMSAVGNASSPIWTTMSWMFSLALGSAILVSQAIGAGDKDRAKLLTASLFKFANIPSVILFAVWMCFARQIFSFMHVDASIIDMSVSYAKYYAPVFLFIGLGTAITTLLQVSEMTGIMIVYGAVRSLLNIILDYILIFGNLGFPRMEVAGAALATTIAELTGDFVILIYVLTSKKLWLRPSPRAVLKAKLSPYIESVKMGLPSACEDFAWNFGNLYFISMLNYISMEAAGIYTIIFGLELIPICVVTSLGNAVLTVSGQETGKRNPKGVGQVTGIALTWSFIIEAFVMVMFMLFPELITSWFTTDASIIAASGTYLLIVGINLFPKSTNITVGSGIKGFGDTRWMLGTQIFGTIFIVLSSTIIVRVLHRGIGTMFLLIVADETIRSFINGWKLRKISKT